VFAFYLLVDLPHIKEGISGLIPVPYREKALSRLGEVNEAISSFLRGQLTIAMMLATVNSIGLMLLGVPLGLVIGIVAGLANMVPYMSLIIGLVPALLLCWAEHGSAARLLGVMGVFGGAQLLEGVVLGPRILSASVNLHPVWVLLAIIAGGNLYGFFGMLLAVPVAAAIQVYARHGVRAYKASAIYGASAVPAPSMAPVGPEPVPAASSATVEAPVAAKRRRRGRNR
jgi:predicted PurR-regulated permease PerM